MDRTFDIGSSSLRSWDVTLSLRIRDFSADIVVVVRYLRTWRRRWHAQKYGLLVLHDRKKGKISSVGGKCFATRVFPDWELSRCIAFPVFLLFCLLKGLMTWLTSFGEEETGGEGSLMRLFLYLRVLIQLDNFLWATYLFACQLVVTKFK